MNNQIDYFIKFIFIDLVKLPDVSLSIYKPLANPFASNVKE
jgi:hypothetical protein